MNSERERMKVVSWNPIIPTLSSIHLALSLTSLDGIGLACGVLEYLLNMEDAPKVIAATHLHEIFENSFLTPRPRLQLGHMEVKVSEESQEAEDQVTYLYKYFSPKPFLRLGILDEGLIVMQLSPRPEQQELRHHVRDLSHVNSHLHTDDWNADVLQSTVLMQPSSPARMRSRRWRLGARI
jgi:hypothetical protein